jgi:hypothetical protein
MEEHLAALECSGNTSSGPDGIQNLMLSYLLLFACNHNLVTLAPAVFNAILKLVKYRSITGSYRPMSLSSCKTMEPMVNHHLIWILESRNIILNVQCGLRRHMSSLDHLVNLEHEIQNSFLIHQHLKATFLNLEKVYDTTWRYGTQRTFDCWNMSGRLPLFISNFLHYSYLCV